MTRRGLSYMERIHQRIHFPECGVNLASGSLAAHRQRQHGVGRSEVTPPTPPRGGGGVNQYGDGTLAQYQVSFPTILTRLICPVEGCQGTASSRTNLQVKFYHRHPWDIIVILEEGISPNPGAPSVICLSQRRTSIVRTKIQQCDDAGRRGSDGGC